MSHSMPATFTVCTIQPAIQWGDSAATFTRIAALLDAACQQSDLDLVLLPEHFNATSDEPGESANWQEAQDFASGLARSCQLNLVAGSVERWDFAESTRRNTAVVYDRQGVEAGRYDKRKLFRFEHQRGVSPGQESLRVHLEGIGVGVLICADLWHPELIREWAGSIDVLCVPSQTAIRPESSSEYARLLWRNLAMTRAQENVIALAVSDHAATSQSPYRVGGVASITDPSAEPDLSAIQLILDKGVDGYLIRTVELDRLAQFRQYRRQNGLLPEAASA
ncbi:MAG: carbon-nitrogen hydrolase family protein [Chloroflexota bacterium]|nr:carbon-nitrogen hydrolase family protein [Chloroflexota bacterium]